MENGHQKSLPQSLRKLFNNSWVEKIELSYKSRPNDGSVGLVSVKYRLSVKPVSSDMCVGWETTDVGQNIIFKQ